jgi:general secretion pathway protein B
MSFILDALKKSETERQRQSGPALFEVKVAPPRGRFAPWAMGLGALLAINLAVVGWMALRGSSNRSAAAAAQATAPTSTPTGRSLVGPAGPAGSAAAAPATGVHPDTRFGAVSPSPGVANTAAASPDAADSATARAPAAVSGESSAAAPDDLAPAVEPQHPASTGVVRATDSGFPTYQDAAAAPGSNFPDLHLDLNAYSPQPDQSFVFLNMMKLHEGDSLPTGVRVEHIMRDGVILSFHGTKFVLQTSP